MSIIIIMAYLILLIITLMFTIVDLTEDLSHHAKTVNMENKNLLPNTEEIWLLCMAWLTVHQWDAVVDYWSIPVNFGRGQETMIAQTGLAVCHRSSFQISLDCQ